MTAIKPIESRRVVAVAAETYPLNPICAHPECSDVTADPHHIFPRSLAGGASYFVAVTFDTFEQAQEVLGETPDVQTVGPGEVVSIPIPHVVGLCRAHHRHLEDRLSKVSLEDGRYLYWEGNDGKDGNVGADAAMTLLGELNPQPGATKGQKSRKRKKGEERRKRRTISLRVPDDTEDGGALWDEAIERVQARLIEEGLYAEGDKIPIYEALMAALNDWLDQTGNTG